MKKSIINHIRRNQRERVAENKWEATAAQLTEQGKRENPIHLDIQQFYYMSRLVYRIPLPNIAVNPNILGI